MPFAVSKFGVYFIGYHKNIVSSDHFGEIFKIVSVKHRSCRVIGESENNCLGFRSYCGFKFCRSETEIVFRSEVYRHGSAAGKSDKRRIADKAWFGNDDLVADIDYCAERKVYCLTAADGNDYFILRVVFKPEPALLICGDLTPQLNRSAV